jgi:hypothetical protein
VAGTETCRDPSITVLAFALCKSQKSSRLDSYETGESMMEADADR